ncbi:uncharacterized protein I303_107835 [Kwoniella dejecticola CBS 10117]|uniref:BTB domain-containing protein n=1 Tax=Kwoniella dejecticola CBS 10117 TaxID=1296121 RepID=A0A1A5ZVU8_9TREE|nr:uncharacterized protein I303_07839 [Kwoniella dejecticola CBS 10117]OBR81929.1 hypothetical protein I303_07839 [Kwoniella dejecticola CBS 10117]
MSSAKPLDSSRTYGNNPDLTLVCADEKSFQVHTYMLTAASSVFRDMISTCLATSTDQHVKLQLSDEHIEKSDVMRLFLDIIYGKSLRGPILREDFSDYDKLTQLILKYDAPYALQHMKTSLRLWFMQDSYRADDYFIFACTIDDIDLAKTVICSGPFQGFSTQLSAPNIRCISANKLLVSRHIMDLGSWEYSRFRRVPDDYKFAYFRAEREASQSENGTSVSDYRDMARRFASIMAEIRGGTFPPG